MSWLLVTGIAIVACNGCQTRHEEAKEEAEAQRDTSADARQQISPVAARIIQTLHLRARDARVVARQLSAKNAATVITEEVFIPAPAVMSDGYAYRITIDHATRQYWWTRQGGVAGAIEKHGPLPY